MDHTKFNEETKYNAAENLSVQVYCYLVETN